MNLARDQDDVHPGQQKMLEVSWVLRDRNGDPEPGAHVYYADMYVNPLSFRATVGKSFPGDAPFATVVDILTACRLKEGRDVKDKHVSPASLLVERVRKGEEMVALDREVQIQFFDPMASLRVLFCFQLCVLSLVNADELHLLHLF